jgi:serine/threonine protein kinase
MVGANATPISPPKGDQVPVIRKKLKSKEITRELQHEKMCLRLLNQLNHPNIIRLLGSYTYRGEHNFLFPCVDMDLKCFFQVEDRFGNFQWGFTFYSALRGLGSALTHTHSLHLIQEAHGVDFEAIGYHHDIRPPNILVSEETFLLADFGLGNLKPADAQSQTPLKAAIGDYLAPECMDAKHNPQDVTRAIDVWAFGCLIAEVATYMQKGAAGVEEFSKRRLSQGRVAHWQDAVFYHHDGDVKDEVKQWLEMLSIDNAGGSLISLLVNLSLQALTRDPRNRPGMATIYKTLTFLSLKAHFIAVQKRLAELLRPNLVAETSHRPTANNLWFLQERFYAWGRTLNLDENYPAADLSTTMDGLHDRSISTVTALFHALENWGRGLESHRIEGGSRIADDPDAQNILENQVDQHVESLWDLLPAYLRRRAQDYWHQAILCTDNKGVLGDVHRALKSRYAVCDVAHAMAMIRKIRLEMLQPDSLEGAVEACTIAPSDVKFGSKEGGHLFSRYKDVPVLVERMRYTTTLKAVNPVQRKLVAGLKAKTLSIESPPEGLRTLHCIGAFEEAGDEYGYGFVYRYPAGTESDPSTLLQRLVQEEKYPRDHPLLSDKFQLAFALANFLKEFHTIGWLHENFNSHNLLFFKSSNGDETSELAVSNTLRQPYVVGLHKSRPDGSFWQTEGPPSDDHLQDYHHPDYAGTGRYRQVFDYYSLGVVLLEIGLWRPLRSLLSSERFRDLDMGQIQSELIEMGKIRLGPKMGAVYREVVLRCLNGNLEEASKELGPGVRDGNSSDRTAALGCFMEVVVGPLEKLATAPI